jgi:hypothetical protein
VSRSPRSKDAAALNFKLGQLYSARNHMRLAIMHPVMSEETGKVLFCCNGFTDGAYRKLVMELDLEIAKLKAIITRRKAETQRRKKEKKNAQVR